MTFRGHMKNGEVVLDDRVSLPDGTPVNVKVIRAPRTKRKPRSKRTLGQRLLKFAGTVNGLPRDMARNHDHYGEITR